MVRKSGLEGVRCTGSGQDDRAAGDLGRVLLHDGRGVLDGEEAAARSRRGRGEKKVRERKKAHVGSIVCIVRMPEALVQHHGL